MSTSTLLQFVSKSKCAVLPVWTIETLLIVGSVLLAISGVFPVFFGQDNACALNKLVILRGKIDDLIACGQGDE